MALCGAMCGVAESRSFRPWDRHFRAGAIAFYAGLFRQGGLANFWRTFVSPIVLGMHFTGVFLKGSACFLCYGYWDSEQ